MSTPRNRKPRNSSSAAAAAGSSSADISLAPREGMDALDPRELVEHQDVAQFIAAGPRRFHIQDVIRFGDQVGRVAESFHIPYLTAPHPKLGAVRVFPVPLLLKVYEVLAAQLGWGPYVAVIDTTGPEEVLRSKERAKRQLQTAAAGAPMPDDVCSAMAIVMGWLDQEAERIRQANPADPAEAPTLKVVP